MNTYYDIGGYFKMHWDLIYDVGDPIAALILEYIIETYPIVKGTTIINGYEYKRYSNSFINEKLLISDKMIREHLKPLIDKGFIDVQIIQGTTKARYIRLLTEVVTNQVTDQVTDHITYQVTKSHIKEPKNKRTKETKRNDTLNKEFGNPNVPLLEDVIKFIREIGCTWLSDLEIEDFYNTVVSRGWKKAKGEPILEWHAYFKWFAEKDKPKETARDRDPGKATEEMLKEWLK